MLCIFYSFLHEIPWLENSVGFQNLIGNKVQKDQNSVDFFPQYAVR